MGRAVAAGAREGVVNQKGNRREKREGGRDILPKK
jgi:hypothetical protein